MFEDTISVVSMWSAMNRWLTPAVLFVVLNIMIGTIAVTSGLGATTTTTTIPMKKKTKPTHLNDQDPSPSFVSSSLNRCSPSVVLFQRLHLFGTVPNDKDITNPAALLPLPETPPLSGIEPVNLLARFEEEEEIGDTVLGRSKSDTEKTKKKRKKLIVSRVRLNKSTTEKAAEEEDKEVDARADDFINKFRRQLQQQQKQN